MTNVDRSIQILERREEVLQLDKKYLRNVF